MTDTMLIGIPASEPASSSLPNGWRTDRDLLILYGTDDMGVAASLLRSGQERILLYLPEGAEAPPQSDVPVVRRHSELMQYVQNLSGEAPALAHLRILPGAQVEQAKFQQMGQVVSKALKSWYVNRNTLDNFGELWLRQVVTNMAEVVMHPTVDELSDVFADRPCVIVSPGPSLEKNIAQLALLQGRAVIMTCPHALHALEKVGIVPDVVVIGDAQTLAWQYADYDFSRISALVLMAGSSPELFELPAQRIFTYGFNPSVDLWVYRYFGKSGFLASGGSVACTELSLAVRMGCPQVAFLGQDLAFDGDRYYAASVRDGESTAQLSEDGNSFALERDLPVDQFNHRGRRKIRARAQQVLEVPGYFGGTVKTSHTLSVFLDWFSVIVRSRDCRAQVFNCTEGGAYIDGMLHVPFSQFLRRLPVESLEPVELRLARAMMQWNGVGARGSMRESLARIQLDLERCDKTAKACLRLARGARGNDSKLSRLSKEEQRLSRELKAIPFLGLIAQKEIRAATEAGTSATTMVESLAAAERLFKVVLDAIRLVEEPLSASHRRLASA